MKNFDLLHHETVYTGRAFSVEVVEARLPDGKVRLYDLVRHPGAVTIIPVDDVGRVWFVRQYRLGAGMPLLELPAGTLNLEEDPVNCAAREVREETGMAARELKKLGELYLAPGYSTELMHIFLATGLYPDRLLGDDDEFLQTEAIPAAEVLRMARDNEINDAKTLAALMLAQEYLESRD